MLHAALHRKLNVHDNEDALTATVFGLLASLPWDNALGPWLATAKPLARQTFVSGDGAPSVELWPTLEVSDDRTCEPDVLLKWAEPERAIAIECKLHSGPSGWPNPGVADVTGQLGRQWCALRRWVGRSATACGLLYVTADWRMPHALITAMAMEVKEKTGDASMLESSAWLSWRTLPAVLRRAPSAHDTARTLKDAVIAYLEALGLVSFSETAVPTTQLPSWGYAYAWRSTCRLPAWSYLREAT